MGWVVWISTDTGWLQKLGVKRPRRVLQAHLDLIVMGVILIALGVAAPGLPSPWSVFLVVGAYTNALLFLPLAFYDAKPKDLRAILAQVVSFSLVSLGTVSAAVYLLTR